MSQRKWEYLLANYGGPAPRVEKLNRLGAEGWELIQTSPIAAEHGYAGRTLCLFKREVVDA